jgi:Glycosyl hydrolase family 79 C-terminal beta domain/IPT/TIG domain
MRYYNSKSVRKALPFVLVLMLLFVVGTKRLHASGGFGASGNQIITLTAYSSAGTNTGTGILGRNISIVPTIHNATDTSVVWSVQGAGSISTSGVYTAPNSMPSDPNVTVTGTLVENSAVSASYSFSLINPLPSLSSFSPTTVIAGTNTVTVNGDGLVPGTVILVNGSPVPSTYQSLQAVTAKIPISTSATGSVTITAQNPTPGGGTSNTKQLSISPVIQLTAYNADGANTGTARLGARVSIIPTVTGFANTAVTWQVTGSGSIDANGYYTAPATMPASPDVTVTATLVANTTFTASYSFTLINPVPVVTGFWNSPLSVGGTNTITVTGSGFVPNTVILVNGSPVSTNYQSYTNVTVQVRVAGDATGSVTLAAQTATPGGGTSASIQAPIATPTIKLTAYNTDGANTGTARLGARVSLIPSITGSLNSAVTWSVSGAGSMDTTGYYTAPQAMPSDSSVTVTAALVANPAIKASYTFSLINPLPTITNFWNSPLAVGGTNSITVTGTGFVPGAVILVNGSPVSTTYQSYSSVTAQVPISGTATGSVTLSAQTPAPGGGTSSAIQALIASPTLKLTAYNADGTNTGTARLGLRISFVPSITGSIDTSINWTVSGAGSVDSNNYYNAPETMPANPSVTVTAALVANPAIQASYTFSLINPVPAITSFWNSPLSVGGTNSITVRGTGFVPGAVILVNGSAVSTTYQSYSSVTAQVPISGTATGSVTLSAQTPAPGGGTSGTLPAPIASPTLKLTAYNGDGTNTGTARLGARISFVPSITGSIDTSISWTVSGAGSVDSSNYYNAPVSMPANPSVTVTAALVANPAIKTSYTFTLLNPVPVITGTFPIQVKTDMTNAVSILGYSFVAGTQVYVNGTAVPTTFVSFSQLTAQIAVADNASGSLSVTAVTSAPGGGSSTAVALPVTLKAIQLDAYNADGIDTGTTRLGLSTQFYLTITNGPGSTAATWKLQGGGTISSNGLYQAPSTMPASNSVTVTAALVSNPSVTASYQFSLLNPKPVISQTVPANLTANQANTVTVNGSGFIPATTILVNGVTTKTTFMSGDSVSVQITPASGTSAVTITAQNPDPGSTISSAFVIPVGSGSTVPATIGTQPGQQIPLNFLGFSHEWGDAENVLGSSIIGVNKIYRQLLKNLMNGGSYPFLIRIGGGSTDVTGEPTASTIPPFAELANDMGVHFTFGVNLGSDDDQLAVDQATAYVSQMPAGSLDAIEIGNEPENYGISGFRTDPYPFSSYLLDFDNWKSSILPVLPTGTKLMGPSWGSTNLLTNLPVFEAQEANSVSIVSQHYYAGHQFGGTTFASDFLLQPASSTQMASQLVPYIAATHQNGQLFRVGEMNSIDQGGVSGISNAFGSSLWSVDTMFELANIGIDGVNWHGASACTYCAFTFGSAGIGGVNVYTLQQVYPLYYGLLLFQLATGNNSKLLPVNLGATQANVKVWAAIDQNNVVHVIILNKDESFAGSIAVSFSGRDTAQVTRLTAPSYQSTNGISIGGQTFDGSIDGTLVGTPDNETIAPSNGVYTVPVQPTSAVLLTIN